MAKKRLVKVQFYDSDVGYENLWSEPIGDGLYRLENTPFFVYGISRGDVVVAEPDEEGRLQFIKIREKSGNRTLRVRSDRFPKSPRFRNQVRTKLSQLGADSEELRNRLLAINVLKGASLTPITDFLTEEAKVSWEYGDPVSMNRPKS
jgi:hypothetical protein